MVAITLMKVIKIFNIHSVDVYCSMDDMEDSDYEIFEDKVM